MHGVSAEQECGWTPGSQRWRLYSLVTVPALSFSLSALLWLAGCAIPQVPYRTIYEDPVNYVRLEEDEGVLPEWPPRHHAHPAFTVDQMTRAAHRHNGERTSHLASKMVARRCAARPRL